VDDDVFNAVHFQIIAGGEEDNMFTLPQPQNPSGKNFVQSIPLVQDALLHGGGVDGVP
jgi:hypothetical protein